LPSRSTLDEGRVDVVDLEFSEVELPVVVEDGMPAQNAQQKPGTARGSPRRSRTAKASHISRWAAKLRCAYERGGWGRISVDGPGHYNPDRSEGPWGRATEVARMVVLGDAGGRRRRTAAESLRVASTKDGGKPRCRYGYAGSRLNRPGFWEGPV
jgi:hypothetical protein